MSLFKSLGKLVGGAVKGFVTGGPLGAITGGVSAVTRRPIGSPPSPADSIISRGIGWTSQGPFIGSQKIYTTPVGGTDGGGLPVGQGTQLPMLPMGAACPVGFRLNKSTYITRGGGTSRWGPAGSIAIHPKGSTCVKRRRRNVGNAKALRRALSRVKGFVKLARRATSLVAPRSRGKKQRLLAPPGVLQIQQE